MAKKTETDLRTLQVPLSMARDVPKRLLEWYDANKRDLPWRRMRNPYATLVSEFMLQQTQVATVVPYFERFLKEYPTVEVLAQASEQDVLRQWAGLGYYSRARNLHASAKRIVSDYGGRVPDKFTDLLFLPGVGRYAAGAIASIGFDVPVPAVDGNVIRVIGRLLAIDADPASPRVRQGYEQIAAQLVPQERAGDYNQSVMELGARVCTPGPGKPDCENCPISAFCQAFAQGDPENYPPAVKRPDTVQVEEACAVVREGDLCFIARCSDNAGRYRNMWEFPGVQLGPDADAPVVLRAHLKREVRPARAGGGGVGRNPPPGDAPPHPQAGFPLYARQGCDAGPFRGRGRPMGHDGSDRRPPHRRTPQENPPTPHRESGFLRGTVWVKEVYRHAY
jgi:A/G-specific adenine glycosylase